ncbi:MAG: hypothetical protein ACT6XY_03070 [Phreatobacter sp.]|jgi:hypothetical protein|uniref:hypothetical protein n=1 Tax=Phreatobacter sp. TaxID=1966341 RepID=UPI0040367EF6
MRLSAIAAVALTGGALLLHAPVAQAAGCGGYVNVFVSGCAPWDNNPRRMPGAPGYAAPRLTAPRIAAPAPPPRIVAPTTGNRFISDQGGGLISNNRGGVIARDGASLGGNSAGSMRR